MDGDTDPVLENNHCFKHRRTDGDAWWMVDLGGQFVIQEVTLYNTDYYGRYYQRPEIYAIWYNEWDIARLSNTVLSEFFSFTRTQEYNISQHK